MTFKQCMLPPVKDALIIGKKAPVGSQGVVRAMQAMSPGMFRHIKVEHDIIESVLVRESDLRKISEQDLLRILIAESEQIMDETDAINVDLDLEVTVETRLKK